MSNGNQPIANDVKQDMYSEISMIPSTSDTLIEIKHSLDEAINKPINDALNHLRLRLEPSILINDEVTPKRYLYRTILKILNAVGISTTQSPGSSIVKTTIDALFPSDTFAEANTEAKALYNKHVSGRSAGNPVSNVDAMARLSSQDARSETTRIPTGGPTWNSGGVYSLPRRIVSVSNMFRDESLKFSGSYESRVSLHRFKMLFTDALKQFDIPASSRVQLLPSALTGMALDYYLDKIRNNANIRNLEQAFASLDDRFDSPHTRAQAQAYLESMTLQSIMDSEQCSTAKALEIAQARIINVSPMCGPAYQDESHRGRWLANMLRHEQWAANCLKDRMTQAQDYGSFVASLNSALTQDSLSKTNLLSASSGNTQGIPPPVFFNQQFAKPPNRGKPFMSRRVNQRRRTPTQLKELKSRTRCLKCGETGHWRAECPNRHLSITDAIKSRLHSTGTNFNAVCSTLDAMALDEDQYNEYLTEIQSHEQTGASPSISQDLLHTTIEPDPFDALCLTMHDMAIENNPIDENADQNIGQTTPDILFVDAIFENHIYANSNLDNLEFHGALVDTGAQKTVCGMYQSDAYFKYYRLVPKYAPSSSRYRFGKTIYHSNRKMLFKILTPCSPIIEWIDIVNFDAPLLFGLDLMKKHNVDPLIVSEQLHSTTENWKMPLHWHGGHLYVRWQRKPRPNITYHESTTQHRTNGDAPTKRPTKVTDLLNPSHDHGLQQTQHQLDNATPARPQIDSTKTPPKLPSATELLRIHRHFGHATAEKLYALLQRSTFETPPNALDQLKEIVDSCQICTEYSPRAVAFRVRTPDKIVFNHRILMDLMWLPTRNPALKRRTRPVLHIVDAGTHFNAATFLTGESTTDVWNAFLRSWATLYVGMPSSMLVDQGSAFLSDEWKYACNIHDISLISTGTESHNSLGAGETYHAYLRRTYNKVSQEHPSIPEEVILALSIKAINDCTGPKGLCPTLLVFGSLPQLPSPSRKSYPTMSERYRASALARLEYERIVTTERLKLAARKPPPPVTNLQFKPGGFAYVYREKLRHYTGPHLIASVHGKSARLHVGERTGPREFNIAQLKHAPMPNFHTTGLVEPNYPQRILYTEIIPQNDPRASLFDEAKREELNGLLQRGAFKIVLKEDVDPNPNIIPSRFVLAIKHGQRDGPPRLKARFVLGGHMDRARHNLVHDSCTIRPESVRLLIALATILGLSISTADWRQGYIQSKSALLRQVFIRPKEMELDQNELVQVVLPIYGLPDAGEYWYETLNNHLRDHCRFQQATTDLALWFKSTGPKLMALAATFVDDVLIAATPPALAEFSKISKSRFDVAVETSSSLSYIGLLIRTLSNGTRSISQPRQIDRLKLLSQNTTFDKFCSARNSLAWMIQTRPDVCCAISMSARVTAKTFDSNSIKAHNSIVRYLRETKDLSLLFPRLDASTLRLVVYTDAGHCNVKDGSSQIGYLITLSDKSNNCAIILFSSKKSRRVVRSTTAAEALAFATGFDACFAIQADLSKILQATIPIVMITDSQILFNILTRRRLTTERRMMVDLLATRNSYANREISNILLIPSEFNPAEALTKIRANPALKRLMATGLIDHPISQYVIEPLTE